MSRLGHRFAVESRFIQADVIRADAFPALAKADRVTSVPKVVIRGGPSEASERFLVGSQSEASLLQAIGV